MEIKPFLVEEWMNQYEVGARYNIAETCVDSVSLDELFQLTGEDKEAFLSSLCARRLTYGDIFGQPAFLEGICRLYRDLRPEQVIPTHGAAGANHHLFCSLVEPGDKVISVMPTYQQLYSIPDSLGAKVELLPLSPDNGFLPDLARLEKLAQGGVKLICLNNPNNPTGAVMRRKDLEAIRERTRPLLEVERGARIVVGMGTCGLAAGARQVYEAMAEEIRRLGLEDVTLEPVGCVGICQFEPVVEVYQPGGVRTTYVHMTPEQGVRVVQQHIRGGNPLAEYTIGAVRSGR